jgi:L-asparaginase
MEHKQKIHIIITGGTIDSHWEGRSDTVVPNEHSVIPDYLKSLKLYLDFEFTEVCMKDSRSLTQEDIKEILKTIEHSLEKKFVITHGTYTMPDTARFIKANLSGKGKVIVLTGSMIPLKGFDSSDAQFALGYAIAQAERLNPGVYLCMNGMSFEAEAAAKNIAEGKFYSVFQEKQ